MSDEKKTIDAVGANIGVAILAQVIAGHIKPREVRSLLVAIGQQEGRSGIAASGMLQQLDNFLKHVKNNPDGFRELAKNLDPSSWTYSEN